MHFFDTLVTSHIWYGRWPSIKNIPIYIAEALKTNLLQSFVGQLFNCHSICIWVWIIVLVILLSDIRPPSLLINKVVVLTHILLCKGLIGDDIIWFYEIQGTPTDFLDKLCNFLVLLNFTKMKSGTRMILKYASDIAKFLGLKVFETLKFLRIYQDLST